MNFKTFSQPVDSNTDRSPERQFEVLDKLAGKMETVPENQANIAIALQVLGNAFIGNAFSSRSKGKL